jgi:hypothetical protein
MGITFQVAPPSIEEAAATAFLLSVLSNESAEAYAVRSGPTETQGSEARC